MDIWFVMKERFVFIAIFTVVILASLFLIGVTWKNRSKTPKTLTVITMILYLLLIVIAFFLFIFTISFGYNS